MKLHSAGLTVCLTLAACGRQPGSAAKQETAGLSDSARIDATSARTSALAQVPGGSVVKEELEQENGRLVYSFDIKKGAEPGVQEVQVDARDGSVVSVEHEDAATEAKEASQDSAAHQ
jgi:uncharacterized membrane protein YkoI